MDTIQTELGGVGVPGSKITFQTVLPKGLLEKANAHHTLYHYHNTIPSGHDLAAIEVALTALRDDIQAITNGIVEKEGQHFWAEVFGDDRSDCKYCASGYCGMYQGNDGIEIACSYAYEVADYECVCLRTRAAERAYLGIFVPEAIGDYPKGTFYDEQGQQ